MLDGSYASSWPYKLHCTTSSLPPTCGGQLLTCFPFLLARIEDGPIKVALDRTLITDLPGVAFGVIATTTKSEDGKPTQSKCCMSGRRVKVQGTKNRFLNSMLD
jgi:hypothetical protein